MGSSKGDELYKNTDLVPDYFAPGHPPVFPMAGNYLLVLFKETPILMAIGIGEFLQKAQLIGSSSFKYLEPVTIVGFLFLLLSYPSALAINKLEERTKRGFGSRRKRRKAGQVKAYSEA